jgi:hypothetical protein
MRICVVYNICGISGRNNVDYYIKAIQSVLDQDYENKFVVVSACKSSDDTINRLSGHFGDQIKINRIDSLVPINVTFNHTCKKVAEYDKECHFLYIDSGCRFRTYNALSCMVERFSDGDVGMLSAGVTTDVGIAVDDTLCKINGLYQGRKLVLNNVVSVGCSLNLHTQIFHRELLDYYNGLMPDIFAGYCTESTFTFLCAALGRQWVYCPDVVVAHEANMDGQSSGFHPAAYGQQTGRYNWDHPFAIDSFMDRFRSQEARDLGLGYEECQRIVLHREDKFDDNELSTEPGLAPYIRENLFLKPEEFDYDSISSEVY